MLKSCKHSSECGHGRESDKRDAWGRRQSRRPAITEVFDAIPDAWERTQEGLTQAACGEGTPLGKLA